MLIYTLGFASYFRFGKNFCLVVIGSNKRKLSASYQ